MYQLGSNQAVNCLADKKILITGAASGIGRATALACAQQGATLILLDKQNKPLNSIYDEIEALGNNTSILVLDDLLTLDLARAENLAQQVIHELGHLNGLFHFAAHNAPLSPMEHVSEESWQKVIQVNLNAARILTTAFLPAMNAAKSACVTFCSGSAARNGKAYWGPTGTIWGAVDSLADIFNQESAENRNIRFFSIDPGAVNTPMRNRLYPAESPAKSAAADKVADAWVYLLQTDESIDTVRLQISGDWLKPFER